MPEKTEKLTLVVSATEYNFILWCRKQEFADCKVTIKDGSVIKAFEVIKSHRFDIDQDI